ncbi:MAG: G5 domain-containing protein [Lachnospiraceae bacterium]
MKKKTRTRIMAAAIAGSALCLIGCSQIQVSGTIRLPVFGKKELTHQIRILDGLVETRLEIPENITVQQALQEAEISLEKGDEVTPDQETVLEKTDTQIQIKRKAVVQIEEDKKVQKMTLVGGKVKDALTKADITLGKHDIVNHALEAYLTNDMEIQVTHRYAIKLDVDGIHTEFLTKSHTVKQVLKEKKIHLGKKDQMNHKLKETVSDGMKLVIRRVSVKRISEFEELAFETETEYSDQLYEGQSEKKQEGTNGKKEIIYEVTYVDGVEKKREVAEEKIVTEPVNTIIVKGTKKKPKPVAQKQPAQSAQPAAPAGRTIISKQQIYDCDGSGHGYYVITWSDGTVEYQDF